MFRKFLFSMVAVLVRSPYLQDYVGAFIIFGATVCLCVYKPYSEHNLYKLDLFLLLVAAVTLLGPLMGRTLELDTNFGTRLQPGTLGNVQSFSNWFLLALNLFALAVFLAFYFSIVRKEMTLRSERTTKGEGQRQGRVQPDCIGLAVEAAGGQRDGRGTESIGLAVEAAGGQRDTSAPSRRTPFLRSGRDGAAAAAFVGSREVSGSAEPAPRGGGLRVEQADVARYPDSANLDEIRSEGGSESESAIKRARKKSRRNRHKIFFHLVTVKIMFLSFCFRRYRNPLTANVAAVLNLDTRDPESRSRSC